MVGVVQLAEHRIVVPGVVGSSPITHPIKKRVAFATLFFIWVFGVMGLERRIRKHASGERAERRRGREERGEGVAAVGKERACFDRRSYCREPQQDTF